MKTPLELHKRATFSKAAGLSNLILTTATLGRYTWSRHPTHHTASDQTGSGLHSREQALPLPGAKAGWCWLPTGREGGGQPLAAGLKKEAPLQSADPHSRDTPSGELSPSCTVSGEEKPPEATGEVTEAHVLRVCQPPGSGAPHKGGALVPPRPQLQGDGCSLSGREAKPGKRPRSPGSGKQKKPIAMGPASTSSPSVTNPAHATHNPVPCGSGQGPCHLANLLSTLAQNSQNTDQKRPLEAACQVRKKTRTLYRSGKFVKARGH